MYYFFSLLSGIIVAFIILFNGQLSASFSPLATNVIIHLIGLLGVSVVCLIKKVKIFHKKRLPLFLYTGGILGLITTFLNILPFGLITVSAILSLSLLGQSVASIFIDSYGLLGIKKTPFEKKKLIGIFFALVGIACMIVLSGSKIILWAIIISFISGITMAFSRVINARLSEETTLFTGTFYNFAVAIVITILALVIFGDIKEILSGFSVIKANQWTSFLGGLLGVAVISLGSAATVKISAFYVTILAFIGQVFMGLIIDIVLMQGFSVANFVGVLLVAIGFTINIFFDKQNTKEQIV